MNPRRRWCLASVLQVGLGLLVGAGSAAFAQSPTTVAVEPVAAAPAEVRGTLKQPILQGQGRLRFLGLRVYEARLWVPAGQPVEGDTRLLPHPLALEIRYQRSMQGSQIAERSLQEMRRQGDMDDAVATRWLQAMKTLFPDVVDGLRITGVHLPGVGAQFYVDGRLRGSVDEPEFARRFFGIWLSPQTSDAKLRAALLGQGG